MRLLTLVYPLLLLFSLVISSPAQVSHSADTGAVVIQKKTAVLVRKGKFVKDYPDRRTAKISYPVIKGGVSNPSVLAKVRSLLTLKNIFDTSLAEYRSDTWLSELDYKINYNKNFILDITFRQEGVAAYPDSQEKHLAINLRTGNLIKALDVFKAASLQALADLVNKKLQAEIQETIAQVNQDKSLDANERESVPGLFEGLKIEISNLDDFKIDDNGLTFLYDAGFPHVVQAYQPVGEYKFSYEELRPYLIRVDAPKTLTR